MALPRKQLQEKLENITPETVKETMQWILDGHTASLEAVQEERDTFKSKAETVATLTQERDEWKAKAEASGDAAKIQADFDAYKQQIADEKAAAQTDADVLDIVKEAGIVRESFQKVVAKDFDRSKIQRGKDGTITNRQDLVDDTRTRYVDFTATQQQQGTPPNNPPTGGGGTGKTKEQIIAIKDPATRQAEMAKNLSLFGIE